MLPPVLKHVDERVSDLARRPQRSRMEPISPESTAPAEHAVHAFGDPDSKPLNAAREAIRIRRFDDKVHVITLDGELDDPEVTPRCICQPAPHGREDGVRSQRRKAAQRPKRHMNRVTCLMRRTCTVRNPDLPA